MFGGNFCYIIKKQLELSLNVEGYCSEHSLDYNLNPEVLHKNPLEVPPSRHFRTFQVLKFIA